MQERKVVTINLQGLSADTIADLGVPITLETKLTDEALINRLTLMAKSYNVDIHSLIEDILHAYCFPKVNNDPND